MAESTLNLALGDLRSEVAAFLGWGREATKWSSTKLVEINALVASALRKFYFAAQTSPQDENHSWSFLKPVASITLPTGATTVNLPDDFGGFEGLASVSRTGQSGGFWPLKIVSEEQIRVRYAACSTTTGRPVAAAEQQIKGVSPTKSNRSQIYVYPIADAEYVLRVPYYILPDFLTGSTPYPYGGAAHAETMKAGCRAAAELYLDNAPGAETANYMMCLAASINYDRRHAPKSLGVNTDRSDNLLHSRHPSWPDGLWHPLGIGFLGEAGY